mgnify:CR=1 FL=1
MWNSPSRRTKAGKRYDTSDLAALIYPLDLLLDSLSFSRVEDVVHEANLQRIERSELVFGIYEVLRALLEDVPIPPGGHPGHHEAILAELIYQCRLLIGCELEDAEAGGAARQAAWQSLIRLCLHEDEQRHQGLWPIDELDLDPTAPDIALSPKITNAHWDNLLQDGCLAGEFLWDDDWRDEELMDLPTPVAEKAAKLMGIELGVVHGLPHSPSEAEVRMAEFYIRYVIWRREAQSGRAENQQR